MDSQSLPFDDQPQAINICTGLEKKSLRYQTLMGIAGSGKTFTMAKIIEDAASGAGFGTQQSFSGTVVMNLKHTFRKMPSNILSVTTIVLS